MRKSDGKEGNKVEKCEGILVSNQDLEKISGGDEGNITATGRSVCVKNSGGFFLRCTVIKQSGLRGDTNWFPLGITRTISLLETDGNISVKIIAMGLFGNKVVVEESFFVSGSVTYEVKGTLTNTSYTKTV